MIKFVLGEKGVGKTRWLIEHANDDLKRGNGNIAFIEVDDDHIFSLDYNVRLINATNYRLNNLEAFYGFMCGLMAMDYDLEKIYVDGIYKVLPLDLEDLEFLYSKLSKLPDIDQKEIYINIDFLEKDMPESFKGEYFEVTEKSFER